MADGEDPGILTFIGVLALLLGVVATSLVYRDFASCMSASEDALTEFPHYKDAPIDPGPDLAGNEEQCVSSLTTTDDTEQVFAYYREQLAANGWGVSEGYRERSETHEYRSIRAERGKLCYLVVVDRAFAFPEKQVTISVDRAGSCP